MFSGQLHLPRHHANKCSPGAASAGFEARLRREAASLRLKAKATTTSSPGPASGVDTVRPPEPSQENAIKVYYRTGWDQAQLHGSVYGGPWQDFPLKKVPSAPGLWLTATVVPTPPSGAGPDTAPFEFVATNGKYWDKPSDGGNFRVTTPGTYRVSGGTISSVEGLPVLVVSDLDGTMIGDDMATGAFKAFWEEVAVLRGGVLAYNTGRSLESFVKLLNDKRHCLAHPDILISAVGTQIYRFDGRKWEQDKTYTSMLDEGWSIDTVREAGYKALHMVGFEKMHFRPADEQNSHKITCGVHTSVLERVLESVNSSLESGKVAANVITSGTGDWRFLDIVAKKAGKLEALTYVRQHYGFPVGSTIACGDSGNDILMMSGDNPAIVVSNAQPDLQQWVEKQEAAGNTLDGSGRRRLVVTKRHEAYGILEGLDYFGFK